MLDLPASTWRKSSYSSGGGNCVEVAVLADGRVAVRDSKDPDGGMLLFTTAAMTAWTSGIKDDAFSLCARTAS